MLPRNKENLLTEFIKKVPKKFFGFVLFNDNLGITRDYMKFRRNLAFYVQASINVIQCNNQRSFDIRFILYELVNIKFMSNANIVII